MYRRRHYSARLLGHGVASAVRHSCKFPSRKLWVSTSIRRYVFVGNFYADFVAPLAQQNRERSFNVE
jgi:hypothetical protein